MLNEIFNVYMLSIVSINMYVCNCLDTSLVDMLPYAQYND